MDNDNKKGKIDGGTIFGIIICVCFFIMLVSCQFGSCSSGGSSYSGSGGSSYSGYSNSYKYDATYRSNVGKIADAYGVTDHEVDSKIAAVAGN